MYIFDKLNITEEEFEQVVVVLQGWGLESNCYYDGFSKVGVCSITGTVKINKWNMFKLRFFMRKVYLITWFKSKLNQNLKVEVSNDYLFSSWWGIFRLVD